MKEEEKEHPVWIRKHGPVMSIKGKGIVCPTVRDGKIVVSLADGARGMSDEIGEEVSFGKYNTKMNKKQWETERRATTKEITENYLGSYLDQIKNKENALYWVREGGRISLGKNRAGTACVVDGKIYSSLLKGAEAAGIDNSRFGKICSGMAPQIEGREMRLATEIDVLRNHHLKEERLPSNKKKIIKKNDGKKILEHIKMAIDNNAGNDEAALAAVTALVNYEEEIAR